MPLRRIASTLLPYALAAVAVLVASAIALLGTVRVRPADSAPGAEAVLPPASPLPRNALLSDPRMAYWRPAASGSLELWVSDLEGGRRWTVATAAGDADIALTRWSPDGSAVAYRAGAATLGVVRLDGSLAALVMPLELRRAAWKIVSYEWSPDAKRIAATFRAGNGLGNESDVYVAEARPSASWQRVTTFGDAYAGRWIDDRRLFIETSSGMVAILDTSARSMRPLTGMPVTSALAGRDGRVYVSGGRAVGADVASQPLGSGWVWSLTIDGDDLRRETSLEQQQARLVGLLADGRAVTAVPGGAYLVSDVLVPLAFAGPGTTVRRVVVPDDGRRVFGLTGSAILQIDVNRIPHTLAGGGLPPVSAVTTLLSGVRDADVWSASKAVVLARSAPVSPAGPKARLAFTLGRALWQLEPEGTARPVLTEPTFFIAPPRWSPSGERLATVVTAGGPARASIVVVGPGGTKRWEISTLSSVQWSPDGRSLALWIARGTQPVGWTTQLYDADSGAPGEAIAGRGTATRAGWIVLTDGDAVPGVPARAGQRIEVLDGEGRREITDARRLAAAPMLRGSFDPAVQPQIVEIVPSGDPTYVGVRTASLRTTGQGGVATGAAGPFVVIRTSDGEPVWVLPPSERFQADIAISPAGRTIAWTENDRATGAREAVVADPADGRTLVRSAGRFAGWSPDGEWVYVARDSGLFAVRLDGQGEARVSAIGVAPVAAARP